jgi:hypothetical protein
VLLVGEGLGTVGQHHGHVVADLVPTAQPRVIQDLLVREIQQTALVDRADKYVEQRLFQCHLYVSSVWPFSLATLVSATIMGQLTSPSAVTRPAANLSAAVASKSALLYRRVS